MALKTYIAQLTPNPAPAGYLIFIAAAVFDGSSLVLDGNGDPQNISGETAVTSTDTLSSLRGRLETSFSAAFNTATGRTDGNTIEFIWLDDKGLL